MSDDFGLAWNLLRRAVTSTQRSIDEQLERERGVPTHWFAVMSALYAADGSMRMGQLADALELHKSTVTRSVDQLEAEGYVKRTRRHDDARVQEVELTRSGRESVRWIAPTYQRALRRHLGKKLTESDITALIRALNKLV